MKTFPQDLWKSSLCEMTDETTDRGRWYLKSDGSRYVSVTTMLGATSEKKASLTAWRQRVGEDEADAITARAAGEGTRFHAALEQIITNQWTPFRSAQTLPNIKHLLNQTVPILEEHISAIHASEMMVYSDTHRIAGRMDCLCTWDGEYTIVDFKRSTKEKRTEWIQDYFLQATAYAIMVEECFQIQIPTIAIVMGVSNSESPQFWHFQKTKYIPELISRISRYHTSVSSSFPVSCL